MPPGDKTDPGFMHITDIDSSVVTWMRHALPKHRSECAQGPRPCPHILCLYNTSTVALPDHANTALTLLVREPWTQTQSCRLDTQDPQEQGLVNKRGQESTVTAELTPKSKLEHQPGSGLKLYKKTNE